MGCPLLDQLPHRSYNQGEIRGPVGAVHGGLIASLADRAGAYAAVRAGKRSVVTSGIALSYLAAATVGPVRAVATTLRAGRQQAVVEVRVHDAGRGDRLVATALLTLSYLPAEAASASSQQ